MWSVSCGMEFQKFFSSCCSVRVVWLTHASLSSSGSHELITLYTENSPLAAESWRTPLIISLRLASCAFHSTPFSSCVDSHCSAFLYWAIPFNKGTHYGWQNYLPPLGRKFWFDTPRTDSSLWRITEILLKFTREYGDILVGQYTLGQNYQWAIPFNKDMIIICFCSRIGS